MFLFRLIRPVGSMFGWLNALHSINEGLRSKAQTATVPNSYIRLFLANTVNSQMLKQNEQ